MGVLDKCTNLLPPDYTIYYLDPFADTFDRAINFICLESLQSNQ